MLSTFTRWWFQIFLIFTPIWGRFPFWRIFSKELKPPTSSKWCSFASFFHVKILPFDLDVLLQLLLIGKEMWITGTKTKMLSQAVVEISWNPSGCIEDSRTWCLSQHPVDASEILFPNQLFGCISTTLVWISRFPSKSTFPFQRMFNNKKNGALQTSENPLKNHRKSVTCLKPCFLIRKKTRWWFQRFFNIHPYLGKIPILANMFQMGWFNHQPEGHWNGFLFFHSKLSSLSLTFHPRYFPKKKPGELHTFLWNHGVFLPPQKMAGIRKWIHFCTHVEELLFGLPVTQRLEKMLTLRGKKKIQVWKENDVFCWIVLYFHHKQHHQVLKTMLFPLGKPGANNYQGFVGRLKR